MTTTKILKNKMIKAALDNFVPKPQLHNRFKDTRPFALITNELDIKSHPTFRIKSQIGEQIIYQIQKFLDRQG